MKGRCFFLTAFAIAALFCLQTCQDSPTIDIREEDGVVVVRNPLQPVKIPGNPKNLTFNEDLRIGDRWEGRDYLFATLNSLLVDDSGNMIALDAKDIRILIFNPQGRLISEFGQKGQGPGEIQRPYQIYLIDGENIAVLDNGNNRISIFSPKGELIKAIPRGTNRTFGSRPDSRGYFYGEKLTFGDQITFDFIQFDPQFQPVKVLVSIPQPPEPPPAWAKIMDLFHYQILHDDFVLWGRTHEYELKVFSPDGILTRRILKEFEPVRITQEDLIEEFKRRFPNREVPEKIPPGLDIPEYFPPFFAIKCDDQDRIYVLTNEKDQQGNLIYDVFDSTGAFFLRFSFSEKESIAAIKNDFLYTITREPEDDRPLIIRYRMEWK